MISFVYDPDECPDWGGTYFPVIVCDACAQPITANGNTYWLLQPDGSIHPQVWHTHKWPCASLDDAIAAQHPGGLVMFEELDCWLDQLRRNFDRLPKVAT
jgi:hypothetical protein